MEDKLLDKYINKVKTHLFGLDAALDKLCNFYVYLLTAIEWVVNCENCGDKQAKLITTAGKEYMLELTNEGLFYRLEEGGTRFHIEAENMFPSIKEIEEKLNDKN